MNFELKGKTVPVFGGDGGLGGAVGRSLADEVVRVAVADIDEAAAENAASAIKSVGNEALPSLIEGRLASSRISLTPPKPVAGRRNMATWLPLGDTPRILSQPLHRPHRRRPDPQHLRRLR